MTSRAIIVAPRHRAVGAPVATMPVIVVAAMLASGCLRSPGSGDTADGSCPPPGRADSIVRLSGGTSGNPPVGGRTRAHYAVFRDARTGHSRGFVLLARGAPGWLMARRTSSSGSVGFGVRPDVRGVPTGERDAGYRMRSDWSVGGVHYGADYDLRTDSLHVADRTLYLGAGNVVLLDRADGVGGPPSVRAAGCIELEPARRVVDRALALPLAREFAR